MCVWYCVYSVVLLIWILNVVHRLQINRVANKSINHLIWFKLCELSSFSLWQMGFTLQKCFFLVFFLLLAKTSQLSFIFYIMEQAHDQVDIK